MQILRLRDRKGEGVRTWCLAAGAWGGATERGKRSEVRTPGAGFEAREERSGTPGVGRAERDASHEAPHTRGRPREAALARPTQATPPQARPHARGAPPKNNDTTLPFINHHQFLAPPIAATHLITRRLPRQCTPVREFEFDYRPPSSLHPPRRPNQTRRNYRFPPRSAVARNFGAKRACVSCSNAYARRINFPSLHAPPMNDNPTGSP